MDPTSRRNPPAAPCPQLARKYYNVDDSSSDDDNDSDSNSSLLILPPSREKKKFPIAKAKDIRIRTNAADLEHEIKTTTTAATTSTNCNDTKMAPKTTLPPAVATSVTTKLLSKRSKSNLDGKIFSNVLPLSDDSDTDKDSDDDLFLMRSKRIFEPAKKQQTKGDPKQQMKRAREEQKEKQKKDRLRKRKEAKETKERNKQKEKITKKRQNEEYNQAIGKYSHEEIVVLLDTELYTDDHYGLKSALSEDFFVHRFPSRLPTKGKTIQFIRKDKLSGGAKDAVLCLESGRTRGKSRSNDNCGYEHIQYLVVLFEPDDFIPLLRRDAHEEEDDYPVLESWLNALRAQWQRNWSSIFVGPRIIFLLYDLPDALDKKWLEYRRHNRSAKRSEASLPTVKELQDATQWLLVQFQVECILCPTTEFLQSTVHKMTGGLSDKPYTTQVTELECIKKIKHGCVGSDDPLEKAKDVWHRQLQQIPGLSESRAQHITEHFPTCQSLWQAYQWEHHRQQHEDDNHDADAACSSLLEDKFSADNRRYKKLSDSVYRVLTSNDPNEMIL